MNERNDQCAHPAEFPIDGYETLAKPDEDELELDAVDYCPDCESIRIWGLGWMEAPKPSEIMQTRLREAAEYKCECGVMLGECVNDRCDDCEYKKDVAEMVPDGFWLGELTGSGIGLCHVFSKYAGNDPHRLPHRAVCGASTGRGAEVVDIPIRPWCSNCEDWLEA